MSWAKRRQFIIIASIIAVLVALVSVTAIAFIYETPTCTDGKQNADETGVDCGGACTYSCLNEVAMPAVRFVRPISPQQDRYDIIAYIDNRNPTLAARNVRVNVELFNENREFLGNKEAVVDIPAGSTVPLYIPEAYRGSVPVAQAFLTFDEDTLRFFAPRERHLVPAVTNVETQNTNTPRINATLVNPSAYPIYDVKPIATVFDREGNAIAASQTFLPQLGAQGEAEVLFTWNRAFTGSPARVEVLPVVPLQAP